MNRKAGDVLVISLYEILRLGTVSTNCIMYNNKMQSRDEVYVIIKFQLLTCTMEECCNVHHCISIYVQ